MKSKTLVLLSFCVISTFSFSQNSIFIPQRLKMSEDVVPYKLIKFSDLYKSLPWKPIQEINLLPIGEKTVQEEIVSRALSGEVRTYEVLSNNNNQINTLEDKPIPIEEVKYILGYRSDTSVIGGWDEPSRDTIIETKIKPEEIQLYNFVEDWEFDTAKVVFIKDVNYYSITKPKFPISAQGNDEELPDSNDLSLKKCFFIKNEKVINKNMVRFAEVKTEFLIHNEVLYDYNFITPDSQKCDFIEKYNDTYRLTEKYNCPFWNSYNKATLFESIIKLARKKTIKLYEYNNPSKEIAKNELLGIIDFNDTTFVEDVVTGKDIEIITSYSLDEKQIVSYVFFEDWYIDTKTLYIEKTIKAIAPVAAFYIEKEEKIIFKPLFILSLEQNK